MKRKIFAKRDNGRTSVKSDGRLDDRKRTNSHVKVHSNVKAGVREGVLVHEVGHW